VSAVVKLSKPIKAHGEEITEITLREPAVEDVLELGHPFLVVQDDSSKSAVELRPKVIAEYVVRLAKVPMSTVKMMTIKDLFACQAAVMGFFGQGDGETNEPSPTEPSK